MTRLKTKVNRNKNKGRIMDLEVRNYRECAKD
jgi:hypothetical protein